jgi:subtilisin family serine protease
MSSHRFGIAAVALLAMMAAAATPPPRPGVKHLALPAGNAHLMAFGGRSAAQLSSGVGGKLDAALADLARNAYRAQPGQMLADLRSMSPAAHFMQRSAGSQPLVAVDAVTRGDPQALKAALESLGLEHAAVFRNDVGGYLPVSAIEAAAARSEVGSLRAALAHTRAAVATQGDFAQGTAALRQQYTSLSGKGVTVGVLSDSFDCYHVYAADQGMTISGIPDPPAAGATGYAYYGYTADAEMDESSGALPSSVNVLEEGGGGGSGCVTQFGYPYDLPFADEGRGMLQIVHAVAPGANLAFYTAFTSEADFANGIQALANAGAKVIADDVGYYDEPFFQDGLLGEAIDTVNAAGVAYFTAAGNESNLAYDNTTPSFSIPGSGSQAAEMLLNMDASKATSVATLNINVPALAPGEFIALVVEWDQPYLTGAWPGASGSTAGASSQIDVCVSSTVSYTVFNLDGNAVTCTGPNAAGTDPLQVLILGNPANAAGGNNTAAGTVSITVGIANPASPPGRIKIAWEDDGAGSTFANFAPTTNPTIQGHSFAAGAATVGAAFFLNSPACGVDPAVLDLFSSLGGSPILFDTNGNRLATAQMRLKPDFVGPDGTNTTFFGFPLSAANITDNSTITGCQNDASYPNYFGTSAATPHAAGLAALMLQANPALTPTQIYDAIRNTAETMQTPTPNYATGYGFIQAGPALASLPPGPPSLTLTPASIAVGEATTLTWTSINVTSCMGSGSWTGSETTSGSMTITPTAAGTQTYTLACSNAQGTSTPDSATLTVTAASSGGGGGHGGGGALELWTLLALAGLYAARLPRAVCARRGA